MFKTHFHAIQILHSIGLQFQRQVSLAEDMDSVLALHREYVTTIFDRCLLNKKVVDMASHAIAESSVNSLPIFFSLRHSTSLLSLSEGVHCERSSVKNTTIDT